MPVEAILEERKNGRYTSVFDLLTRLDQGAINKKGVGKFSTRRCFRLLRGDTPGAILRPSEKYDTFIEHLVKFASSYHSQKMAAATSLFGDVQDEVMIQMPTPPACRTWSLIEKLDKEKEVTGIFISGHPLDDYRLEIENFVTCSLNHADQHQQKSTIQLAGSVSAVRHMISKNGNGWGIFSVSDFDGELEFRLFGEDYQKFKHLLEPGWPFLSKLPCNAAGERMQVWNLQDKGYFFVGKCRR
ncbi:MAG: hypothetical protein R2795_19205 [Saprospiraceae bacterium]